MGIPMQPAIVAGIVTPAQPPPAGALSQAAQGVGWIQAGDHVLAALASAGDLETVDNVNSCFYLWLRLFVILRPQQVQRVLRIADLGGGACQVVARDREGPFCGVDFDALVRASFVA